MVQGTSSTLKNNTTTAPGVAKATLSSKKLPTTAIDSTGDVIEKLTAFVSAFDGSDEAYSKARPIMLDVFDEKLILGTAEGDKDLEFFCQLASKFAADGNQAKVEDVQQTEKGVKIYIRNTISGRDMGTSEQEGTVKNRKIVEWRSMPMEVVSLFKEDDIAQKYRQFIDAFDGSASAWSNAKPLFEALHSTDLVVITEKGNRDYNWSMSFLETFAVNGNISQVVEMERTEEGLRAVVRNIIDGMDIGLTEERGIIKDGKVVLWGATASNETSWQAMIDAVQLKS